MLLNQDGAFECTFRLLRNGTVVAIPRWRVLHFLLFDADQHLTEEIALKLLPGLAILAYTNHAMEAELAESVQAMVS